MKVQVRSYGAMGDLLGKSTNVEIPEGSSIADLTRLLVDRFPDAAGLMPSCFFAIADAYAPIETRLFADQDISILPPASGG